MKSFDIKTKVYFGDNALDRLSEIPYKKVLVITDPFLAQSSMINLITDPFFRMLCRIRRLKRSVKA